GLLTVLIFNALARFNARELQDLQLVGNDEVRV
ncbi:MAG: cobalamin biosynthesis protein CbiM, partial [Phycisphaerae bacterium]|nr:cobalamin biosynthesis protein CbiM [Phycisphaerae bacterium]